MSHSTKEELALDRLLGKATPPPPMAVDLAARIAARARHMPQQRRSVAAPYAAGMALAASLALGIWLGAAGIGLNGLPGFAETASLDELTADGLTGLGELETLSGGETL